VPASAGGHPDLPAGGHEEDPLAITERDQILYSTHRRSAPNADLVRAEGRAASGFQKYRTSRSVRLHDCACDRGWRRARRSYSDIRWFAGEEGVDHRVGDEAAVLPGRHSAAENE